MGLWTKLKDRIADLLPRRWRKSAPVVAAVRLVGPIGSVMPFSAGMSLATVADPLERAFTTKNAPAVAILLNSPGGSPVQSRLIFERIRSLAEEHGKKVHVFVEDVAASGGYMIACAGDDIIADPSSIVGSIGVVSAGFGFVGLIERLGIERRVHTSGEKKVVLDSFRPERPEDVAHLESLQREVHESFIDLVRERRGLRLRHDEELFTGLFWSGKRSHELGLVDALGDMRSTLRERYGDKVRVRLIEEPRGFFLRRNPAGIRGSLPEQALGTLEARSLWARFGL